MMRGFISLLIIIVTIFSSGIDVWVGDEFHESTGAFSNAKQITQTHSVDIKSAVSKDSISLENSFTSNQDHDCHLGHCSFEIRNIVTPGSISASRDNSIHANGFLPDEPIFYIPRPPTV